MMNCYLGIHYSSYCFIFFTGNSYSLEGKRVYSMASNLVDEIDCASFFDHIDDLVEFSPENECGDLDSTDCKNFPSICNDPLPDSGPLFFSSHRNSPSDFSAELLVPVSAATSL